VFVALAVSSSLRLAPADTSDTLRLARLQVIDTIAAPRILQLRPGERVRLVVDRGHVPAVGSKSVVFATGWLAGEQLSFFQVARFTVRSRRDWADLAAAYDSLRFVIERAKFQQSVAASDLTAVAVVQRVVQIPDTRPPIARSEHDPVWARVSIDPIMVVKGTAAPGRTIQLLVPTNRSHLWKRVPAVVPGDTALFILSALSRTSPLVSIDSSASFVLADSVAVRRAADTVLTRASRPP
jgi:hypothetical protein